MDVAEKVSGGRDVTWPDVVTEELLRNTVGQCGPSDIIYPYQKKRAAIFLIEPLFLSPRPGSLEEVEESF